MREVCLGALSMVRFPHLHSVCEESVVLSPFLGAVSFAVSRVRLRTGLRSFFPPFVLTSFTTSKCRAAQMDAVLRGHRLSLRSDVLGLESWHRWPLLEAESSERDMRTQESQHAHLSL